MSFMDYLPETYLVSPDSGTSTAIYSKHCGLSEDVCAQCKETFVRPRNHVHYKRTNRGGKGVLHFCSWKCIRKYDEGREAELEAKKVTPQQKIARLKEKIAKDMLMLETEGLTAQERNAAQKRIHQRRRDIRLLEEELFGYWTEGENAGSEC